MTQEKCPHPSIDLIAMELGTGVRCIICNNVWRIDEFTNMIRYESELKGFNEGIDTAKKLIEDNMKYYDNVTLLKDAMKSSLENLKRSG